MVEKVILFIKALYSHEVNGTLVFNAQKYNSHQPFWAIALFLISVGIGLLLLWLAQKVFIRLFIVIAQKSETTWDDTFIQNRVIHALAILVPLFCFDFLLKVALFHYPIWRQIFLKIADVAIIIVVLISVHRALNAIRDGFKNKSLYKDKPIQSYFQITKMVITGVFIILILSRITNQSPLFFLTSLGAMTAILVLVFKDTILGFVGSIQLSANDMIRLGDWVTMDKYGADGDVIEINIATVKVQNFDKTITTIPTYAFISDSFINWRGMQESDGRRIKRSLFIQIDTIHFAEQALIEKLNEIVLLKDYIHFTQSHVDEYNKKFGFSPNDQVNARRQTNIGLFRNYIELYLKDHPGINQDMPLLVRQLAPTPNGIPLEIYCFTRQKEWSTYEKTMADIFDHLFAVVEFFELELFENLSGRDVRMVIGKGKIE